jgi:hypothetical protein
MDAHQDRINQKQEAADFANLPKYADQVAKLLAKAHRDCELVGIPDLNQCKLGQATAKSDQAGLAGVVAGMSLALEEHFIAKCIHHNLEALKCESLLKDAKSAFHANGSAPK